MKVTGQEFEVTEFNIDGVLNLDKRYELFKTSNIVEFGTQWQIGIGVPIGFLLINAAYTPKNKVDLSNLCVYKTFSKYTFLLDNYDNEQETIKNLVNALYKDLANGYNEKIIGTKMQVPFPPISEAIRNQIYQRIIQSLHKTLERIRNIPPL